MGAAKCCAIVTLPLLLICVILLGSSFKVLNPLEAGIKQSTVTAKITEGEVYTSGRYFLDVTHKFLKFPTTLIFVEFSNLSEADGGRIPCRTTGGQIIRVGVSFQLRLMVSSLTDLYKKHLMNYKKRYITIAQSAIKSLISQTYSMEDCFTKREEMRILLHANINALLQKDYAVVEDLQLLGIEIEDAQVENTILNTLVEQQRNVLAEIKRASVLVNADTGIIMSRKQEEARVVQARAAAEAKILVETANAEGISIRLNATAKAYRSLRDDLGYSSEELMRFLYLDQLRELNTQDRVVVDVESAILKF